MSRLDAPPLILITAPPAARAAITAQADALARRYAARGRTFDLISYDDPHDRARLPEALESPLDAVIVETTSIADFNGAKYPVPWKIITAATPNP